MIWLLQHSLPASSVRKLVRQHTRRTERKDYLLLKLLMGERKRGWGRSKKSLVLYKSFNTPWLLYLY